MAILQKTVSVWVSSIQIMQVRVQKKGKSVWKSRYDEDVSGRGLLLCCQMLLRSWLYCMHHGLGQRLFGGGGGDLGGRCRARAGGRGMWDVEGGLEWGSGVDYLPG